jgi:hypothetical protein
MMDIVSVSSDIGLYDTQTTKAANILSVQLGELEFAPTLGIDLKYFLSDSFKIQNESFKAYLIEVLANNSINVASVLETVESLLTRYVFNIKAPETSGALIAR